MVISQVYVYNWPKYTFINIIRKIATGTAVFLIHENAKGKVPLQCWGSEPHVVFA
jgi:hypothetical protein